MNKIIGSVLLMAMVLACSSSAPTENITNPPPRPATPPPHVPTAPFTVIATYDSVAVRANVSYDMTAHVHLFVQDATGVDVEDLTFHSYVGWAETNSICQNTWDMHSHSGYLTEFTDYPTTVLSCNNTSSLGLHTYFVPDTVKTANVIYPHTDMVWMSAGTKAQANGSNEVVVSFIP